MGNTTPSPEMGTEVPDPSSLLQQSLRASVEESMDPAVALDQVLLKNARLEVQNQQKEAENELLKKEAAEAKAFAKQFEEYADILSNPRSYLPVFLRDRIIFKKLLIKLRMKYGKRADIDSESKSGKQQAHLRVDHAVEVIIEYALLRWHEIEERLER